MGFLPPHHSRANPFSTAFGGSLLFPPWRNLTSCGKCTPLWIISCACFVMCRQPFFMAYLITLSMCASVCVCARVCVCVCFCVCVCVSVEIELRYPSLYLSLSHLLTRSHAHTQIHIDRQTHIHTDKHKQFHNILRKLNLSS